MFIWGSPKERVAAQLGMVSRLTMEPKLSLGRAMAPPLHGGQGARQLKLSCLVVECLDMSVFLSGMKWCAPLLS